MSTLSIKAAKLGSLLAALMAFHAARPDNQTLLLLAIGLTWVALQLRDFKPNRRLRVENSELRTENDDQLRRLGEKDDRISELEKSRDFDSSFAVVMAAVAEARTQAAVEHRAILEEIKQGREQQHETWATFHQQLAALTSAIQVVASGILSDTREVKHETAPS